MTILAIRAEPGCAATVDAGARVGLTIEACPLFEIRPLAWQLPDGAFDGVLLGSVNAFRHGGPGVDNLVDKPVYAVGETTAAAARERGFRVANVGEGGLQSLLDSLGGPIHLLRLAGRERVSLDPPAGITVETAVVYETVPLPSVSWVPCPSASIVLSCQ